MKGHVSITRYTGGPKGSGITISLTDDLSGCECVEIKLPAQQFGDAVTGHSLTECEFEFRPLHVGMRAENKTEIVPFKPKYSRNEGEAKKALKPFEVDGWIGRLSDLRNHHCNVQGQDAYRVVFYRWVTP